MRLRGLVRDAADATIHDEFAHAEGEILRSVWPVSVALRMADPPVRRAGRPEGVDCDGAAFRDLLAANLTSSDPCPERKLF